MCAPGLFWLSGVGAIPIWQARRPLATCRAVLFARPWHLRGGETGAAGDRETAAVKGIIPGGEQTHDRERRYGPATGRTETKAVSGRPEAD
ncbi:MAG: DUF1156 domain-containing protein [Hyphomonadaceae bacterium]|nr:DUF1156 domain-containing protein [Hyphomonadaceae bacterium]